MSPLLIAAGMEGRHRIMALRIAKIGSGGQTGVDRAAWDAALARGIAISGFVPKGRWAEDGRVPARYGALPESLIPTCAAADSRRGISKRLKV